MGQKQNKNIKITIDLPMDFSVEWDNEMRILYGKV